MDIFEESVKTSMTSMLLCLMFMMLFYPYHDTSGIQNSCDRTHGTNAESIHGLVASLMVVLSWWFSHGGSLRVSITLSLTVSFMQGFVSGCCPKRLLVKKIH